MYNVIIDVSYCFVQVRMIEHGREISLIASNIMIYLHVLTIHTSEHSCFRNHFSRRPDAALKFLQGLSLDAHVLCPFTVQCIIHLYMSFLPEQGPPVRFQEDQH